MYISVSGKMYYNDLDEILYKSNQSLFI